MRPRPEPTPWSLNNFLRLGPFICPLHIDRPLYKLVQVKRREFNPWPKSTPFFRVRPRISALAFYDPLRRRDLTRRGGLSATVTLFGKFGDPYVDQTYSAKKKRKKPPPEVRPRDGHIEHVCKVQNWGYIFLKWRGHSEFLRKSA